MVMTKARQVELEGVDVAAAVWRLSERLDGLLTYLRAEPPSHVLGTEVLTIGADGFVTKTWSKPFQAVMATNLGTSRQTVTTNAAAAAAPTRGPGVTVVEQGCYEVVNMRGDQLTVFGTVGEQVGIEVYTTAQPPAAGVARLAIATPNTFISDADGQPNAAGGAQAVLVDAHAYVYDSISGTWNRQAGRLGVQAVAPGPPQPLVNAGNGGANTVTNVAITPAVGLFAYLTGFEVTSNDPAASINVVVTVTGISDTNAGAKTLSYFFNAASTGQNVLAVQLPTALKGAAAGGAIQVSCPALGVGGQSSIVVHGFQGA